MIPVAADGPERERGSAVVDFVLVGALLTMFFLAIIQLALVLHVRNTLIDAAASGARYGTLADRSAADARQRTGELIATAPQRELRPGHRDTRSHFSRAPDPRSDGQGTDAGGGIDWPAGPTGSERACRNLQLNSPAGPTLSGNDW